MSAGEVVATLQESPAEVVRVTRCRPGQGSEGQRVPQESGALMALLQGDGK
jgi:hypothetical protein